MGAERFHPDAEDELRQAAQYYEARSEGLGLSFLSEVRSALGRIREHPESGRLVGDTVRQTVIRRFPYSLLYGVEPDGSIWIVAVMHLRRSPGYWRGRR